MMQVGVDYRLAQANDVQNIFCFQAWCFI